MMYWLIVALLSLMYLHPLLKLLRLRESDSAQPYTPTALVVVPVRGAEDTFPQLLRALLEQDYQGRFEVRVVVDSPEDPAWQYLAQIDADTIQGVALESMGEHCSLKNSSLMQEASRIGDAEVMVCLDSDVIPPRHWLRTLINGLADEQVKASFGLRWYVPQDRRPASLLLHAWSQSAVLYHVGAKAVWAGSCAYKAEALPALTKRWEETISDGIPVSGVFRKEGWQIACVPLVLVTVSSTTMRDLIRFQTRQCWMARVHGVWLPVLFVTLLGTFFWCFSPFHAPGAFLFGWAFTFTGDYLVRDWLGSRAGVRVGFHPFDLVKVPLGSFISMWCCLAATFKKTVCWRGIWYQSGRRLNYAPWQVD
ncbi:MAG: glycosyltransferase family 2 protein [Bdellovibrionales bacterium]|nr:glycosyltransferase family 2 protein [Bdellovibrionales bacterium]